MCPSTPRQAPQAPASQATGRIQDRRQPPVWLPDRNPSPRPRVLRVIPVQGKSRNQIEEPELEIHHAQQGPKQDHTLDVARRLNRFGERGQSETGSPQHNAYDGTGHSNEKLCSWSGRFLPHMGHASENEEGDPFNGNAIAERHVGMAELVQQDGEKQEQRGNAAHRPIARRRETRQLLRQIPGR